MNKTLRTQRGLNRKLACLCDINSYDRPIGVAAASVGEQGPDLDASFRGARAIGMDEDTMSRLPLIGRGP